MEVFQHPHRDHGFPAPVSVRKEQCKLVITCGMQPQELAIDVNARLISMQQFLFDQMTFDESFALCQPIKVSWMAKTGQFLAGS